MLYKLELSWRTRFTKVSLLMKLVDYNQLTFLYMFFQASEQLMHCSSVWMEERHRPLKMPSIEMTRWQRLMTSVLTRRNIPVTRSLVNENREW